VHRARLAAGHARILEIHSTVGTGAVGARGAIGAARFDGHHLQSVHALVPALTEHGRQLPGAFLAARGPMILPLRAVLFDSHHTSRDPVPDGYLDQALDLLRRL